MCKPTAPCHTANGRHKVAAHKGTTESSTNGHVNNNNNNNNNGVVPEPTDLARSPSTYHQQLRTAATATLPKCLMCVVAAAFHLHVFANAIACLLPGASGDFYQRLFGSRSSEATSETTTTRFSFRAAYASYYPLATIVTTRLNRLEVAVFLAYSWDVACLAAGVVPFSRARHARDILSHHVPVFAFLCVGLPLGLGLHSLEPAVALLARDHSATRVLERINGWGFMSSLNEAMMSAQQAETLWHAARHKARLLRSQTTTTTRQQRSHDNIETSDDPTAASSTMPKPRAWVFHSDAFQLFELCFKLAVFTAFPLCSLRACATYDAISWAAARRDNTASFVGAVLAWLRSPVILRTLAWRAFVATQYPFMAKRTLSKLARVLSPPSSSSDKKETNNAAAKKSGH